MKNRQSGYHLQKVKIYQIFGKIAQLFFPFSFLLPPLPRPLTTNFPFPAYTQHSHHQAGPFSRWLVYRLVFNLFLFNLFFKNLRHFLFQVKARAHVRTCNYVTITYGLFSLFHECVRFTEWLSVTYMPADLKEVNKVECPGGGTAIHGLYRYVPLWRLWLSNSLL